MISKSGVSELGSSPFKIANKEKDRHTNTGDTYCLRINSDDENKQSGTTINSVVNALEVNHELTKDWLQPQEMV